MRQKDDKVFADVLNRIREGKHTRDDEKLLRSRVVSSGVPADILHLFPSCKLVNQHNTKSLGMLQSREICLKAKDCVLGDVSKELKKDLFLKAQLMPVQQTQSLPFDLSLKVGGKFMLVQNVDIKDGLTNGASGTLHQVGLKGSEDPEHVFLVWIEFDDETVGSNTRRENKHLYTPGISCTWTPVFPAARQFPVTRHRNVAVLRRQFPLAACSAITIHKSQGSTLAKVAVSFQGMTQPHLVYVALSRAKTLDGLHLLDFDPNKIKVSPDVLREMERLRKQPLEICLTDLHTVCDNGFVAAFHNSRSLHNHVQDLGTENNLLKAGLLFVFETWEWEQKDDKDYYHLPGFKLLAKNCASSPSSTHRPHAGTMVFVRSELTTITSVSHSRNHGIEITVVDVSSSVAGLGMMGVYCPPHVSITTLCTELRAATQQVLTSHSHVVIGGDFNNNAADGLPEPLQKLCEDFGMRQVISGPTTDYGSTLDLIFTNLPESSIAAGVLESWYSDHKPCWSFVSG